MWVSLGGQRRCSATHHVYLSTACIPPFVVHQVVRNVSMSLDGQRRFSATYTPRVFEYGMLIAICCGVLTLIDTCQERSPAFAFASEMCVLLVCVHRFAKDTIVVPRTVMSAILDNVDRAERAAAHAVRISSQAREAFESESRQLSDLSRDIRRYLDRF
jgi:hypothetical protein